MTYGITDNRITIQGFFFEQDTRGNIHIYDNRERQLSYYDMIDFMGLLPYKEFVFKCEEWLIENN